MKLVTFSKEVHHIDTVQDQTISQRFFQDYADLFTDELGELPVTYAMRIAPTVMPVISPPRCIPVAMQEKVKQELQDLGVIKLVDEPTERFKFNRMPFGINTASEVFQRAMEQIFAGYPCAIIVDDIIISGTDAKEHEINLEKVLDRARKVKLRLNKNKCKFGLREVSYVGHVFPRRGLKADPTKIAAIIKMPPLEDKAALRCFLGMVTYLGAACLQDGRPVAYALHVLTETEERYAQIEKELLAVVFTCHKFYDYIYGKPVVIETDHQPLITIHNKAFHAIPARLQRMMLTL
ncbi:hypothetical protein SRHO_G00132480 [Serrasalmus rhombeus]